MKLNAWAFGNAAGFVMSVYYAICAGFVILAPQGSAQAFRYLFREIPADAAVTITLPNFLIGLVMMYAISVALFWSIARLYNGLIAEEKPAELLRSSHPPTARAH
jgi:hypothetical protein